MRKTFVSSFLLCMCALAFAASAEVVTVDSYLSESFNLSSDAPEAQHDADKVMVAPNIIVCRPGALLCNRPPNQIDVEAELKADKLDTAIASALERYDKQEILI